LAFFEDLASKAFSDFRVSGDGDEEPVKAVNIMVRAVATERPVEIVPSGLFRDPPDKVSPLHVTYASFPLQTAQVHHCKSTSRVKA
jgi:hypothetical protein